MVKDSARLALHDGYPVKKESVLLCSRQLAVNSEIEQLEPPVGMKYDIAGMQIGMKQTVGDKYLQQHVDQSVDQFVFLVLGMRGHRFAKTHPLDPIYCQKSARGHFWMGPGDGNGVVAVEILAEPFHRPGCLGEVQLVQGIAAKLCYECPQV